MTSECTGTGTVVLATLEFHAESECAYVRISWLQR